MLSSTSSNSSILVTECYWDGIGGSGNKQILDARHSELFLEEAYWDQTLQYEHLGEHFQDEEVANAFCAIVNAKRLTAPSTACMFQNHLITPMLSLSGHLSAYACQ